MKLHDIFNNPPDIDTFVRTFEREPFHAPHSFNVVEIEKCLGFNTRARMMPTGAVHFHVKGKASEPLPPRSALLVEGGTLCFSGLEKDARAQAELELLARDAGLLGDLALRVYDSDPGQGFDFHFDGRVSMTLQMYGTKEWVVGRYPRVPLARQNHDGKKYVGPNSGRMPQPSCYLSDQADEWLEVKLQPGDVLVVPSGTWHQATAGEQGSVAINISWRVKTLNELAADYFFATAGADAPAPLRVSKEVVHDLVLKRMKR